MASISWPPPKCPHYPLSPDLYFYFWGFEMRRADIKSVLQIVAALLLCLPTLAQTPQKSVDLNGTWTTDDKQMILVQQNGTAVTTTFKAGRQECKYGGGRAKLIVEGTLAGSALSGYYQACATSEQLVKDCKAKPDYLTKFTATVSADGKSISGKYLADGWGYTEKGAHWTDCHADVGYEAWLDFSLRKCGAMTLDSPDNFKITSDPRMPVINAEITDAPGGKVSWEAQIKFTAPTISCSGGPDFDSDMVTGNGPKFSPDFGNFYGGALKVTATSECGKESQDKQILGTDPGKSAIQEALGGASPPFDPDDLKRIACNESGQCQFRGSGDPLFGTNGDAGIMQICYARKAADIWNWQANIATGKAILQAALAFSKRIPALVRTKAVRGQGPFPDATDFTSDQVRLEAIKRYNAGFGANSGYWQWDPVSKEWVANPRGGIVDYVNLVLSKSPTCPGPCAVP